MNPRKGQQYEELAQQSTPIQASLLTLWKQTSEYKTSLRNQRSFHQQRLWWKYKNRYAEECVLGPSKDVHNKQHGYETRRETEDGHSSKASMEVLMLSLCNYYTPRFVYNIRLDTSSPCYRMCSHNGYKVEGVGLLCQQTPA